MKKYTISVLNDSSRMEEVYRLIHDTFVSSGEIVPQKNGMIITDYCLDSHPSTIILIAEQEGEIIGTISATVDSEIGLNMDKWFDLDVARYRALDSCKIGATWRLATLPSFRGSRRLIVDLITTAIDCLIKSECTTCLFALMSKHKKFYQVFMKATVVSTKMVPFEENILMELNLMEINLEHEWAKNKFKQLKIV